MALTDILRGGVGGLDGLTLSVILGGSLVALLWRVFTLRLDSREPPILKPDVPVVGHIIGMIRGSHGYWPKLYQSKPLPAATLPMLNGKMYVLNDPGLISAAFRARTLSFDPFLLKTIHHMIPISGGAMDVFRADEFQHRFQKVVYSKMTGADLLRMNAVVLGDVFGQINRLPANMEVEDTFLWFRSLLTMSTIVALVGKEHSWKMHRNAGARFWEYEAYIHYFVLGPAPWLTCPSAYESRAELHKALIECDFSSAAPTAPDVSALTKDVVELLDEHHWTASDKAALFIAIFQGAIANTVPTAYWYMMHIMSSPKLVAKLRKELARIAVPGPAGPDGKREVRVDLRDLSEENMPLLTAAFRENQRMIGVGSINRWVVSDTVVTSATDPGRSYLLRKDNALLIPQMLNHMDAAHWGPDVAEFRPERFLPAKGREFHGEAPVPRGAFTPFGGGKHLCPGRNFASAENWGTMIALLLGFEMTTPEGEPLEVPERTMPTPAHAIGRPVAGSNLRSSIRRRKGWENVVWKVAEVPGKDS
ncbi:hypothetical protein TruAng_001338 [Truncatella angustata]|nr:hypothetical protein TruAng_001338 [Truncatella angustata]